MEEDILGHIFPSAFFYSLLFNFYGQNFWRKEIEPDQAWARFVSGNILTGRETVDRIGKNQIITKVIHLQQCSIQRMVLDVVK